MPRNIQRFPQIPKVELLACSVVLFLVFAAEVVCAEEPSVQGALVANGQSIELSYVYVWAEEEGFYDPADPTWTILFTEDPVEERDLGDTLWNGAWIEIGLTETAEFGDVAEVRVYSQSLRLESDGTGNISGGTYPQIEVEGLGTEQISGRVFHTEEQSFFDDTYHYDLRFSARLSDPSAPIGEPLPAGGGEPGKAYLQWIRAVHSGDLAKLKAIVPQDMADQLDAGSPEEAAEQLEFMQLMTPKDAEIVSGSSDGDMAILKIRGEMEGETVDIEVTMTRMEDFWLPTATSM